MSYNLKRIPLSRLLNTFDEMRFFKWMTDSWHGLSLHWIFPRMREKIFRSNWWLATEKNWKLLIFNSKWKIQRDFDHANSLFFTAVILNECNLLCVSTVGCSSVSLELNTRIVYMYVKCGEIWANTSSVQFSRWKRYISSRTLSSSNCLMKILHVHLAFLLAIAIKT